MESTNYIVLKDLNKIQCLECNKLISGINTYNIKRHYSKVHKKKNESLISSVSDYEEQYEEKSPLKKPCVENPFKKIDKNKFLKSCVGLVTVKNLPFGIFDDKDYFKVILSPCEIQFGTNINSKNIVSLLSHSSVIVQNIIKNKVKNQIVSLKLDIVTRMGKSLLGVNIQYMEDFKILINTIGMIQLYEQHSAQYIKDEIDKCLKAYDIEISQIYSITTDNGANIIKASKMLQEEQAEVLFEQQNETTDQCDEHIHKSIASVFSVVRCAAHNIQLAINDVIKSINQITNCRELVKTLLGLVPSSESDVEMLALDNATRWNSTFEMMQSLLNLKDQIQSGILQVLPSASQDSIKYINWDFIEEFVTAFNPLSKFSSLLQGAEQYIIGDFYREWLNCEIELEDISEENQIARDLLTAFTTGKKMLLRSDAVVAGLYFDPRFNYQNSNLLSEKQKSRAMIHLIKTCELIKKVKGVSEPNQQKFVNKYSKTVGFQSPNTSLYSKLEQRVHQLDCSTPVKTISIRQKLIDLGNYKRVPFETDVLQYWKNTNFDGDLKDIAEVVLALPVTQVSVERAFSALSLILTKGRSELSGSTINELLLTKFNYEEIRPTSVDLMRGLNLINE